MQNSNYHILETIGSGSIRDVFKVQSTDGNFYAMKVLKEMYKDDLLAVKQMHKEADSLKLLKNDKIVSFVEVIKTQDGRSALIEEFVPGKNLESLLASQGEYKSSIMAAIIVSEILYGLEEAHRQHIIHRDLKPDNIMITPEGRILITDFGVAKNLRNLEQTQLGLVVGSPTYMSPEQVAGTNVDERSDLFSLGVMLYRISTGQKPFIGENYQELSQSILHHSPKSAKKYNPWIHPDLNNIINRALAKNVEDRFQKAYEFRFELLKFLDRYCSQSIQGQIQNFYNGKNHQLEIDKKIILKDLLTLAYSAKELKNKSDCIALTQQVLTIDAKNEEAKTLIKVPQSNKKSYILVLLLFLIIGPIAWELQDEPVQNETLEVGEKINKQVTNNKVENIEDKPVKLQQAAIEKTTSSIRKTKHTIKEKVVIKPIKKSPNNDKKKKVKQQNLKVLNAYLKMNIDKSTKVFIDGKQVLQDFTKPIKLKPGSHHIELRKDGFNPIGNNIFLPVGKTTVINAR